MNSSSMNSKRSIPSPGKSPPRSNRMTGKMIVDSIPFISVHLGCLLVLWGGFSPIALLICILLIYVRLFGITGGFHRYFSHRSFKTSRVFQFFLAILGTSAAQMGPLWWASTHRHHHRYSDTEKDFHSPVTQKFWWSHFGWIMDPNNQATNYESIRDFAQYPELRFLNRYHMVVPITLAVFLFSLGVFLNAYFPSLQTSGVQMLAWGFFLSTVILYHLTFTINSLAHTMGNRRFETKDHSRNNWILGILLMGEGWHNNHHFYPGSERQGFYWWELDTTHYILIMLSWFGLVWDLRSPSKEILEKGLKKGVA